MYCPKCGKQIEEGRNFCTSCGVRIKKKQEEQPLIKKEGTKPEHVRKHFPKKAEAALWIGGAALVLTILVYGAYLYLDLDFWGSRTHSVESSDKEKKERKEDRDGGLGSNGQKRTDVYTTTASTTEAPTAAPAPQREGLAETTAPAAETTQAVPDWGSDGYILPDSSMRLLTENDLAGFTGEELRYARNEIYARHGRLFDDTAIQDYFNSKSWYYGVIAADSFTEDMLSQIEKDNIRLIKQVEEIR